MSRVPASRAGVLGLGASGHAAALALADEGIDVFVSDSGSSPAIMAYARELEDRGISVETSGHSDVLLSCDLVIVSPGIPPHAPAVQGIAAAGIALWSEIELAYRLAECDLLAVTGTNGKTTTTALLASMLSAAGVPSVAAGNIGLPLVQAVREIPPGGAIAAEVSSFQLASIHTFRPAVAVVLNVAPDHIDWHGYFESYLAAKARIVENQTPGDAVVYNAEDPGARGIAALSEATRKVPFSALAPVTDGLWADGALHWRGGAFAATSANPLPGSSGLEDALAAAGAALEYGVPETAVASALSAFRPLSHRLETIAVYDGITYIDDSKATNPHAALTAVRGLDNVALIAGGRSKGIDLSVLADTVPPVAGVVALGEAAEEVERVFSSLVPVKRCPTMEEAVSVARSMIDPPGSVLLAPGCASLDMYDNYAARGDAFARAVRDLIAVHKGEVEDGSA